MVGSISQPTLLRFEIFQKLTDAIAQISELYFLIGVLEKTFVKQNFKLEYKHSNWSLNTIEFRRTIKQLNYTEKDITTIYKNNRNQKNNQEIEFFVQKICSGINQSKQEKFSFDQKNEAGSPIMYIRDGSTAP